MVQKRNRHRSCLHPAIYANFLSLITPNYCFLIECKHFFYFLHDLIKCCCQNFKHLWCRAILLTGYFYNLPFCQLAISSTCHFINLPFHQLAISSTCHFIKLPIHQIVISSTCHFINLPFHQLAI